MLTISSKGSGAAIAGVLQICMSLSSLHTYVCTYMHAHQSLQGFRSSNCRCLADLHELEFSADVAEIT